MEHPLAVLKCAACRGDGPPLTEEEMVALLPHAPDWGFNV